MQENKPILGPKGTKKVIVASHERSGTHFLMNTLAYNFGYISAPWIDIDIEQVPNPFAHENFSGFLYQFEGEPILNTFKTHFQVDFFIPIMDEILSEYHVFYIHRGYAAVMESFAKHLREYPWDAGPKVDSGPDLASSQPAGYLMRYQKTQIPTMFHRWKAHVSGWTRLPDKYREKIIYVKFEDLDHYFEHTVMAIGAKIGRTQSHIARPSKYKNVMTPGRRE